LETFPGFILGSARVNLDGETDPFVVRVVDVDRRVVDAASHDLAGRASAHDLHGVLVRHARLELRLVMGLDPLGGKRLGVKRHLVDEAVKARWWVSGGMIPIRPPLASATSGSSGGVCGHLVSISTGAVLTDVVLSRLPLR
jgi:hypothetical protein